MDSPKGGKNGMGMGWRWEGESFSRLGLPHRVVKGGEWGVDWGRGGGGVPRQDADFILQIRNPAILRLHLHSKSKIDCLHRGALYIRQQQGLITCCGSGSDL